MTSEREKTDNPLPSKTSKEEDGFKLWGFLLFGLIGATATTIAAGQLRQTIDWVYTRLNRSRSYFSWNSNRSSFKEEAWKKYYRRMQEEHEDEMERLERIRRMQNVFNRARNKRKTYETWSEYGPGAYHQHFQRDDWDWNRNAAHNNRKENTSSRATRRDIGSYVLSHHYSVLGLDRIRATPYTDAEIKTAFRTKAMEYHPDQNQGNEEAAEAKFKEVMMSYEAIKLDRDNKS